LKKPGHVRNTKTLKRERRGILRGPILVIRGLYKPAGGEYIRGEYIGGERIVE
jgi:hypothetical protein